MVMALLFIFQGMAIDVGTFGRTKVPTDSRDTTKILEIDGLLNVLIIQLHFAEYK